MLEMLTLSFMQRALVAGLIVAVVAPSIGLFLVLRRLALYGDALSHVTLTGVAAGMLAGTYPVATGLAFAVAASLGMDWLRQSYRKYSEMAVAIVLAGALALAVILLSLAAGSTGEIMAYLFGSIVTVSRTDVLVIAVLGVVVLGVVSAVYKELLATTFDEEYARIGGMPVRLLNMLFYVLVALTVGLTMRVVGALLVSSLMVVPVGAALQVARSFRGALLLSVGFGLLSVLVGLSLAYLLDLAPGGTVVFTAVVILLLVTAYKRIRSLE
ncbi:metal ABC transporter permease [Symbiobacterium terraclitae]|uniref:metal ABC transporter permease n=1 Tax=Symbiobacterium terraclitae TaxID=557451 RepID=UPI0035B53228